VPEQGRRTVHCGDALTWLEHNPLPPDCSLVTSLPDRSEFPELTHQGWEDWFVEAASCLLRSCPEQGVVVFYQSDLRSPQGWTDKGFLCQQAARRMGVPLLWHKIVCRVEPGCPSFGRPGYSHLLCFSPALQLPLERSFADVLPRAGRASWQRGMGLDVCRFVCRFLRRQTSTRTIVAPFCGQGLLLAVANAEGLDAIGIERSPSRARRAGDLRLSELNSLEVGLKLREIGGEAHGRRPT
jgi:hypothetical protein